MMTAAIADFRRKLETEPVFGPFSKSTDPAFIEILGHAGFDFVIIDMEHGPNPVATVQNLIRAAQVAGVFPIVRVKEDMPSLIGEVLDVGAGGVQVPKVASRADAEDVVRAARFAPHGMRGVCRFVRAAEYSAMDRFAYFRTANTALVIVQLEGKEAIQALDAILGVAGIDVAFVGPYDLSQSVGVPGQVDHPLVEERMMEVAARCAARGIALGTFTDSVGNAAKWRERGVRYLSYSVDVGIFYTACRQLVSAIRPAPQAPPGLLAREDRGALELLATGRR